jgi:hypothetical protein
MSLPNYDEKIENEIREAGLTANPIGRPYRFGCTFGSHHQILIGTIEAVTLSDEGGLTLHGSNRRFWGMNLVGFYWSCDKQEWAAVTDSANVESRYFPGDLVIR